MIKFKTGYVFVFFQFLYLGLIFLTGPNIPSNFFLLGLFIFGVLIGLMAIWNMRKSKLRTEPEVAKGSKLVTDGIYKYLRHPMYLGLILVATALVLDFFSPLRLIFLIILIFNQLLKLTYEEGQLAKNFKDFENYKKNTKKLIPFIF